MRPIPVGRGRALSRRTVDPAGVRPRRSIPFLITTGEEAGFLGSDYFVWRPTVPAERIVANINVDGGGASLFPIKDIVLYGNEHTTLGPVARRAAAEARSLLEALHARAEQGFVPPTSLAWIYLGLAEIDAAFEWLNRAVEECDQFMMPIKSYEFLDPIRADPRFLSLLRKMNLEP